MKNLMAMLFCCASLIACQNSGSGSSNPSGNSGLLPANASAGFSEVTPECVDFRTDSPYRATIEEVCVLTNQQRAQNGLKALTLDSGLSDVAEAHAVDMVNRNFFSHTNPDGLGPFERMTNAGIKYTTAGENIAYYYKTPADVMNAWMNSAGHRANILNGSYGKIGIGFYQNYWVQDFTN